MPGSDKATANPRLRGWKLACPRCRDRLHPSPGTEALACPACGDAYPEIDGIWRLLDSDRRRRFQAFLDDYRLIRRAEGRGFRTAGDYLRLPEVGTDHPWAWQWRIRRRSFDAFRRKILGPDQTPASILDLGAGCGWLSHRLAELGHEPLAIDVNLDEEDGLAAARHYAPRWLRAEAEFDRLPLADACADLAVFNASFHYGVDALALLREALRVLQPGGRLVILDSPIYRDERAGRRMAEERHAEFERRHGTRSESLPSIEFLTWEGLEGWAETLGLKWEIVRPWYGWKWALTPWLSKLKGNREPARFAILALRKD